MHLDYTLITDLPFHGLVTWAIQVGVVIGAALILTLLVGGVASKILKRRNAEECVYFLSFIESFRLSVKIFIWVLAFTLVLHVTNTMVDIPLLRTIMTFITSIQKLAIILWLAFLVLRFISRSYYYLKECDFKNSRLDPNIAEVVYKLSHLIVIIIIGLILLQNAGASISGLLAFGGIGGLAVGLAAKDMLANLFGGLVLYLDRPFKVGEKIRVIGSEVEGWVEEIGWRKTRVRNYERQLIYAPNSLFGNSSVVNNSRIVHRRIRQVIGLRYQDISVLPDVLQDIREYLNTNKEIDKCRILEVRFVEYAASSLDMLIYCFAICTEYEEFLRIQEKILFKEGEIIAKHGAEIAFPTRTLDVSWPERING